MNMKKRALLPVLFIISAVIIAATTTSSAVRIIIIGDSTVMTYAASKYPWAGWGQEIGYYFKTGSVTVINHAVGGRSSRSFVNKGNWASTLADMQSGDWLFIQFGHNDRDYTDTTRYTDTATYKKYLAMYIDSARSKGVHPVLVTPMNMNTWTDTATKKVREVFTEGANNYRAAMINVGDSIKVPVLDLEKKSTLLMDTMGCGYMTKFHFMGLDTNEYPLYPTGYSDGTHFQEEGSLENARMITEEIARLSNDSIIAPLAEILATRYKSTVSSNLSTGGTITKSRVFPPGATVTIKVKPASGKTFLYWANAATGDSITDSTRHTYVQDTHDHSFIAFFKGGSTVGTSMAPAAVCHVNKKAGIISAVQHGSFWTVRWSGDGQNFIIRITDLFGRRIAEKTVYGKDGSVEISSPTDAFGIRLISLVRGNDIVDVMKTR